MTESNNKQTVGLGVWVAFTLFRNLTSSKSTAHSPSWTAHSPSWTAHSPSWTAHSQSWTAHSPSWTANSPSACQESTCNLWKLKIHYRVHKIHHFVSWARWLQSLPSHPVSWRSVLILPSSRYLGLPNRLLASGFSTRPCMTFYHVQCNATWLASPFFSILST